MSAEVERMTLTIEQAARVLGLSRNATYELARQGRLPGALRFGRRLVVSRIALERALENAGREESAAID